MSIEKIVKKLPNKPTIVFISKKYHNTAGLFSNQDKYNIVRVHADDLALEPRNYFKVSSDPLPGISYDNVSGKSSFFYPNIGASKDFYELVDSLSARGPLYYLDYSSTKGVEEIMEGKAVNLGVPHDLSHSLDKIDQFELLDGAGFDLPRFRRGKSPADIVRYFNYLDQGNGIFIAGKGSGGSGVHLSEDVGSLVDFATNNFYNVDGEWQDCLLEQGLDLKNSISVDLLISDRGVVLPYCGSESLFGDNKLGCLGSVYPMLLPEKVKKQAYEYSRELGKALYHKTGMSGEVNVDLNVLWDNSLRFCEFNFRPGASTGNKQSHLEATRPKNVPSMTELLVMAKTGQDIARFLPGENLWERDDVTYVRKRIKVSDGRFVANPDDFSSHPGKIFSNREISIFKEGMKDSEGAWGIIGLPPKGYEFIEGSEIGKMIIAMPNDRSNPEVSREKILKKLDSLEKVIAEKVR